MIIHSFDVACIGFPTSTGVNWFDGDMWTFQQNLKSKIKARVYWSKCVCTKEFPCLSFVNIAPSVCIGTLSEELYITDCIHICVDRYKLLGMGSLMCLSLKLFFLNEACIC